MKKKHILLAMYFFLAFLGAVLAQQPYTINVNVPDKPLRSEHLNLGGANPAGDVIDVNNYFLTYNDKPFMPITGEFHYFRYPEKYWDESLKKMKAGGINVIATYVFWITHEEKEGQFVWEGNRNLRRFVELCAENGLQAIVRIGPFCHGEVRNGGLPDWLLGRPLTIRSNDPAYLGYVDRFYGEIGQQIEGLYFKDGGPIIGIQIENEYQHSASPWGLMYPGQPYDWTAAERDLKVTHQGVSVAEADNPYADLGNDHMMILKSLAQKAGMDVPLYTATGWGYAAIAENESIPVTSLYAYPFWTEKKDLSPFFLYKDMHANPDYSPVRYVPEDYPAFAAELGSGIMTVYTRRPVVDQRSMDAMINRCLGSGANGLGYYMYHGGSTSKGENFYFADEAYGLPKVSYDFQAPVGEYGQLREGFHRLKLVHRFLADFGELLAPMWTVLPENTSTLTPDNLIELRYAARAKDGAGFLFFNNFQDDAQMTDQVNIKLRVESLEGDLLVPEEGTFDLAANENAIFPFHFDLNGAHLNYATAQLMMKGDDPDYPYYVFFTPKGVKPEFSFVSAKGLELQNGTGCSIEKNNKRWLVKCPEKGPSEFLIKNRGVTTRVLVVDKDLALKSWLVTLNGKKHLFFSEATVLQDGDSFTLQSVGEPEWEFYVYPRLGSGTSYHFTANRFALLTEVPVFSGYKISMTPRKYQVETYRIGDRKLVVKLPDNLPKDLNDLFLTLDYTGDTAMGFLDGELVTDEFYKGFPWSIGLRRFYPEASGKEMVFYFRPLQKNATFLPDLNPGDVADFGGRDQVLEIREISFTPEYETTIQFLK